MDVETSTVKGLSSRGRSMTEVILAVGFVSFLIGFVAVLCVGNYYRATRAMERQKQKRLARLAGHRGNGVVGVESPRSDHSSASTQFDDPHHDEHQSLLMGQVNSNQRTARRRHGDETTESLLLDLNGPSGPRPNITAV